MPKFLKSLAVLLALPLVLVGCKINSINYFPPTPAHIRVVNVLGTTLPIDIAANGVTSWTNLGFEAMTGYLDFDNVETKITVTLAGSTSTLVEQTYSLTGDQNYTLIVFGTTSAPSLGIVSDVVLTPPSGQFQLNVFAAAPIGNGTTVGNYPVDMYLTRPGEAIDNMSPTVSWRQLRQPVLLSPILVGHVPAAHDDIRHQDRGLRFRPAQFPRSDGVGSHHLLPRQYRPPQRHSR